MNRSTGSLVATILLIATVPAVAQWLNVPTKGIPRTKDGKPNLSVPAPRKPDGKPDLSGLWQADPQNRKYIQNLAEDFKLSEFPIQPWAEALTRERQTDAPKRASSLPLPAAGHSITRHFGSRSGWLSAQDHSGAGPGGILYEDSKEFRQIFLDGRTLLKDPNPTWLGYSVGRWDGDTLVVDTTGFNGKIWLDVAGHPATDALHITERFPRRNFGHIDLQLTIDDPKAYTKPWTVTETSTWPPTPNC